MHIHDLEAYLQEIVLLSVRVHHMFFYDALAGQLTAVGGSPTSLRTVYEPGRGGGGAIVGAKAVEACL